ncbi:MAG: DUF4974 domain-containing protein [Muribaculaceae bacterium]|nr:DUF4974 domain-containing protein [Muribaculaceae bacterium]
MNKTDLLLQMLEQPECYSEAQWQEILADDECRELYTLMAKVKSTAPSPEVSDETIDAEWQRLAQSQRARAAVIPLWRKVAVTAAIAVTLFGLSYAAVTTGFFGLQKQDNEPKEVQKSETPQQLPAHEASSAIEVANDSTPAAAEPRLYDNVPLEQMLAELSAYYQVDVEYRTDDVRSLRLYYEWEPDYSLDMVVDMLSHFESLSIYREGNKLIVESAQEGKR